jgi:NADH dehydrogenase
MAGQIAELARDTLRRDFRTHRSPPRPHPARRGRRSCTDELPTGALGKSRAVVAAPRRNRPHRPNRGRDRRGRRDARGRRRWHGADRQPRRRLGCRRHRVRPRRQARRADWSRARPRRTRRSRSRSDPSRHAEVFAIGDMVRVRDPGGEPVVLPRVAPVAMQQGRYAASVVRARLRGRERGAFRYRDRGNLATIGRAAAVADIRGVRLSGFLAWATWLLVLIRWSFSFETPGRGADSSQPRRQRASSATAEQPRSQASGCRDGSITAQTTAATGRAPA